MAGCNPVSTPLVVNEKLRKEDGGKMVDETHFRSLVGNLLYLTATRPDIMFARQALSRFMHYPSHLHLGATKDDWGGCIDDMKNTSGYAFSLGSGVISWYISASLATSQAIWLRRILEDIKKKQNEATYLLSNSDGEVQLMSCKSEERVVDIFTKALPLEKLVHFQSFWV
ncbi:hypothetical protein AAG906_007229 [Vitis piasezkii]